MTLLISQVLHLVFVVGVVFISSQQHLCDGKVMMEYIGATGKPVSFNIVPIQEHIDFFFLLGFAIDSDPEGNPQNGKFSPYWLKSLTPQSVAAIKSQHPNVKVLASLSGWSIHDKVLQWYNPKDTRSWIVNAFKSLKSIIKQYHLDGIDIDYETFPKRNPNSTFAFCVGELITLMKNQNVITVATIAPYHKTVGPYVEVFRRYRGVLDYVNYQFYTDKVRNPGAYLEAFQLRASQFDKEKLLPSYEVNGRGIQGDAFFDALTLLKRNGSNVNGIMIFSADESTSNNFYFERKSQSFLL